MKINKKTISIALILFLGYISAFGQAQKVQHNNETVINGELRNINQPITSISVMYSIYNGYVGDESLSKTTLHNHRYTFTLPIGEPTAVYLIAWIKGKDGNRDSAIRTLVFTEPGKNNIIHDGSFSNVVVANTKGQSDLVQLQFQLKNIEPSYIAQKPVYKDFFVKNPQSPIALYVLAKYMGIRIENIQEAEELFAKLPKKDNAYLGAKNIADRIVGTKNTAIGQIAPDFAQPDTSGNMVSLSSLRGKYVLLDFWASWCHSCREEIPNIKKAYEKYKQKGFEVLSVSLDGGPIGRKSWINAIKADGTKWLQISDLSDFKKCCDKVI